MFSSFIQSLFDPDAVFMRNAICMALICAIPFGIIGSYIVIRRTTYIAGAIAHAILGGIGIAVYCRHKFMLPWLDPLYGAVASALLAAILIGVMHWRAREREDTVIGAIWAIGMSLGIIALYQTPGYQNIQSYLFGNILIVSGRDIWLSSLLTAMVLIFAVVKHRELTAMCFDPEFAKLRGVKVERLYYILLLLTALTIVLLVNIVGIVLVIALLTLPAAIAGRFSRKLWQMMAIAVALSGFFTVGGVAVSYEAEMPAGPIIVVIVGAVFLFAQFFGRRRGV